MNIIKQKPKDAVKDFLNQYSESFDIDIEKAEDLIKSAILYYNGKERVLPKYQAKLESNWYSALKKYKINYSVYSDKYYFTDLWACWIIYSRQYIRSIITPNSLCKNKTIFDELKNIKSVLDIGCGIGYTTTALTEIFSNSKVYGLNLKDTEQYIFDEIMAKKFGFTMVSDITEIKHSIDLFVAFEYFEHIQDPINHLENIVKTISPKYFYIASSFNTRSVGHFKDYKYLDLFCPQSKISRIFNNTLRSLGYKKIKTKLWNNKPSLWKLEEKD